MFKALSMRERFLREQRKRERLEARQNSAELATSIAFVTLAESGSIDEVTATEHMDLFAPWVAGAAYEVGALRQHDNELYRCVQAHTSQEDWAPGAAAALWSKAGDPTEAYPAWSQPVGAQDAYAAGDTVSHTDKKWVSAVNGNVWEPGVYGWEETTG